MDSAVQARLESVSFGPAQVYRNITVLPLIASAEGTLQYRTLGEALANWDIAITEVSDAGSVPELMVVNRGKTPVLLVDGEELAGAKQNRALNTSILLKEISETRIPVSGTEQGRWCYASKSFRESGNVMAYKSRSKKARSVHSSLEAFGAPASDQGEVWRDIAELQAQAGAPSPTAAMSDVYGAWEDDLRKWADIFKSIPNQVGLFALVDGRPAGVEMVSLGSAYANLHPKLVRSYALEALLARRQPGKGELDANASPTGAPADGTSGLGEGSGKQKKPRGEEAHSQPQLPAIARSFLAEITRAEECRFASVGHGTDFRYKAKDLEGSALVHENEVIHAAFFRLEETGQPERVAPRHRRRGSKE